MVDTCMCACVRVCVDLLDKPVRFPLKHRFTLSKAFKRSGQTKVESGGGGEYQYHLSLDQLHSEPLLFFFEEQRTSNS